jgi:hypothetical protein
MKRKQEEELIRLAFGDAEPQEAARAQQVLEQDAQAQAKLAQYREIREGLKQLSTPAHQLSTERLREAILQRGLVEKPRFAPWKWSLAPLAAAAGALLFTLYSAQDPAATPAASGGGAITSSAKGLSEIRETDVSPEEMLRLAKDAAGAALDAPAMDTDAPPVVRRESPRASRPRMARAPEPRAAAASVPAEPDSLTPREISRLAINGALPAGALAAGDDSGAEPIVLIGAESDELTGAKRATEVESASNVVIGG